MGVMLITYFRGSDISRSLYAVTFRLLADISRPTRLPLIVIFGHQCHVYMKLSNQKWMIPFSLIVWFLFSVRNSYYIYLSLVVFCQ